MLSFVVYKRALYAGEARAMSVLCRTTNWRRYLCIFCFVTHFGKYFFELLTSLSSFISLSHSHTHTHTHMHPHTLTHNPPHTHSHPHTQSPTPLHSHTLTQSPHTLTHNPLHSRTLTPSHPHTQTLTPSHTIPHTLTPSHPHTAGEHPTVQEEPPRHQDSRLWSGSTAAERTRSADPSRHCGVCR